ncbi:MAG: outer membrane protein, partial [Hyphomicrobium sp.]
MIIGLAAGLTPAEAGEPTYNWSGVYIGAHTGGAIDYSKFSNPYGPTLFGDEVRSPGPIGGLQFGGNYQMGQVVLGLQADVSGADMGGTFTCLQPAHNVPGASSQFMGGAFGATCQAEPDWFGTLTGRVGVAVGPQGRILLYGKGGLAWAHTVIDMAIDNSQAGSYGPDNARSKTNFTQLGGTLGAGVEYALSGRWSVGLEYDYLHFGNHDVPTPASGPFVNAGFQGINGSIAPDGTPASVSQDVHAVKLAINYQLGDRGSPEPEITKSSVAAARIPGFETELGGRYVYAWTRFQQDLGKVPLALPVNNSRLTWKDQRTNGGELFGRV